jgi:hypothetical protein
VNDVCSIYTPRGQLIKFETFRTILQLVSELAKPRVSCIENRAHPPELRQLHHSTRRTSASPAGAPPVSCRGFASDLVVLPPPGELRLRSGPVLGSGCSFFVVLERICEVTVAPRIYCSAVRLIDLVIFLIVCD